jgi:hypothetical protein
MAGGPGPFPGQAGGPDRYGRQMHRGSQPPVSASPFSWVSPFPCPYRRSTPAAFPSPSRSCVVHSGIHFGYTSATLSVVEISNSLEGLRRRAKHLWGFVSKSRQVVPGHPPLPANVDDMCARPAHPSRGCVTVATVLCLSHHRLRFYNMPPAEARRSPLPSTFVRQTAHARIFRAAPSTLAGERNRDKIDNLTRADTATGPD